MVVEEAKHESEACEEVDVRESEPSSWGHGPSLVGRLV